jgi:hypothetical protein
MDNGTLCNKGICDSCDRSENSDETLNRDSNDYRPPGTHKLNDDKTGCKNQ